MQEKKYNIGQLAELTGLSRRTIRFYIQSELVPPPHGAGRGHYYDTSHLQILQRICSLKDNKKSLEQIKREIKGESSIEQELPAPTSWTRIEIIPGIELNIEGGRYPITPGRLKKIQHFLLRLFGHKSA